ncbi:class I SAM-dependent methyltransferase [Aquamicrobium sp. LC103]|uniref:class I SAM-dependent methyltransferase n=1 Tax=Aquamicrobium sp. LC103 TaxID=1120658 RepID=UPI00063EAAEB|nr:class I SAM-dependent methyltransferase [Aquamicrobium sp. LC103]
MPHIEWKTDKHVPIGNRKVPLTADVERMEGGEIGITRDTPSRLLLKKLAWPLHKLHHDLFVDGFIEWKIGRLIAKHRKAGGTVLDVASGDFSLMRYVGAGNYNALDIRFSEFHLRRMFGRYPDFNPVLASATAIPAGDAVADVVLSTEALSYIPEIETALSEIRRVLKKGGTFICSISNEHCYMHERKGPNPATVHRWNFSEFSSLVEAQGFRFVEGSKAGWWLPLPRWLTNTSYCLPVSPTDEYKATNFFYVFEAA